MLKLTYSISLTKQKKAHLLSIDRVNPACYREERDDWDSLDCTACLIMKEVQQEK